jgi:hypothetical protein
MKKTWESFLRNLIVYNIVEVSLLEITDYYFFILGLKTFTCTDYGTRKSLHKTFQHLVFQIMKSLYIFYVMLPL